MDQEDATLQKILKDFDKLKEAYDVAEPVEGEDVEIEEEELDDNVEEWIDEIEELSPEELANLKSFIGPVKYVLVKVSVIHLQPNSCC